ncbi:response regulator receiver modulated diguanylate cyclase [Desulfonatronum thiosulfatophilum]|uniref:diguanylate cyclase n=1 Tax=Desulfonatronum thiosulfatophilum TaxID=617002 RepID=A0A1G6CBE2_9BACT|nr:diguanylate cyclase [Desulfonatronum thiosulfatophilum]SDB30111.1 response regulator receiver modulated diguanylate cyclase [Desulfonatronum thiosulfatophilum]
MVEETKDAIEPQLQALRDMFRQRLEVDLPELQRLADMLLIRSSPLIKTNLIELNRILHKLAGSAGTFGFSELGAASRYLEIRVQQWLQGENPSLQDLHALQREIHSLRVHVARRQPSRSSMSMIQAVVESMRKSDEISICLAEAEEPFAEELSRIFGHFGYTVNRHIRLAEAAEGLHRSKPDVLILDVTSHPDGLNTIEHVALSPEFQGLDCPMIFLSDQDTFEIRMQAARIGAEGFFLKPVDIPRLIDRVEQIVRRRQALPYRLLIVDDDEELARHYSLILRGAGMESRTLSDPVSIFEVLDEFQPDLILMDLNMPGYTGVDLARVIRMHDDWLSLPIIYLSAETDIDQQLSAMSNGGDDFLTKPISDRHLVVAVSVRAARMRQLNELMVKDSLTGLLKHSRIKEQIALEYSKARRVNSPLCVAMLDIDHFKQVNDTYGHAVGDQVIKALAHLLKQRLRKSDSIGRYGGEEFAVALVDCDADAAIALLDDIRMRFKEIRFSAEKENFTVTLSVGAIMAADYPEASSILVAADEALYNAKRGGRDRICLGDCLQTRHENETAPHEMHEADG